MRTTDRSVPPGGARPTRSGVSVRVRITGTVAFLVAAALSGAGLIVYAVESDRIDEQTVRESQQELDEFVQNLRIDEQQGTLQQTIGAFLRSNVPDDDELLIGWVGSGPTISFPGDPLVEDEEFLRTTAPLVRDGGTARLATSRGEVLISTQPARQGEETGALVVVNFLAEDRAELNDTMRTYAIVSALFLLVVVGFAFWQSGRLLAPLRDVRRTAEEITETDLSRRLPVSGNDDITALTRTVNGMLERLESAFLGQRQLLDDAGHELKTPLTILRGHLELLDADNPDDVTDTRALLLDEVDRMARLVTDLILLAKTHRPDFLGLRDVDIAALTETVLAKARVLGERTWVLDEVASGHASVDEQRLTQALLQLADNAVKHTAVGGEIALGSSRSGSGFELWVRDDGAGVPLADQERIFERFGRSSVPDGDEGFGLGLSIVTAIAHAHGGDVRLDPTYLEGARFVLRLPARTSTPPEES